jgi:peptidoglycan/LPS O-acetylase OafA/YrhL
MQAIIAKGWDPRVEGLRGVAIVFVFHLSGDAKHNWGALGVSIFFIISGYVITGSMTRQLSLDTSREIDMKKFLQRFYIRRARRLLPLAITVILITLVISLGDSTADRQQYVLSAIFCILYVGNFFGFTFGYSDLAPGLGHFWSLAVEEQFYFVWPIVFWLAHKSLRTISQFKYWIVLGVVLIEISHPLIAFAGVTVWTLPSTYFDLLLLGCALNLIKDEIEHIEGSKLIFIRVTGCLSLLFVIFGFSFSATSILSNFQYNFNFLLAGSLFIYALRSDLFDNFVLKFFGKISYSLYCIHAPLIVFCRNFLGDSAQLMVSVGAISIVLSMVSHRYFESKFYKPVSHS